MTESQQAVLNCAVEFLAARKAFDDHAIGAPGFTLAVRRLAVADAAFEAAVTRMQQEDAPEPQAVLLTEWGKLMAASGELATFARTVPGRLPQRVTDALAIVDSFKKEALAGRPTADARETAEVPAEPNDGRRELAARLLNHAQRVRELCIGRSPVGTTINDLYRAAELLIGEPLTPNSATLRDWKQGDWR